MTATDKHVQCKPNEPQSYMVFWIITILIDNNILPLGNMILSRLIAQFPPCSSPISHNAPSCNRNMHTCAHCCYQMVHGGIFDALWDLWDCSIACFPQSYWREIFIYRNLLIFFLILHSMEGNINLRSVSSLDKCIFMMIWSLRRII